MESDGGVLPGQNMGFFPGSFWVSVLVGVSTLFLALLVYGRRLHFRFSVVGDSGKDNLNSSDILFQENREVNSIASEQGAFLEKESSEIFRTRNPGSDETDKTESSDFVFRFRFPSYEEFVRNNGVKVDFIGSNGALESRKDEEEVLEKPEVSIHSAIEKSPDDSNEDGCLAAEKIADSGPTPESFPQQNSSESEAGHDEIPEETAEKPEKMENALPSGDNSEKENNFLSEKTLTLSDFDTNSIASSSRLFSSDGDFEAESELFSSKDFRRKSFGLTEEEEEYLNLQGFHGGNSSDYFSDEDSDIMNQLRSLEESQNFPEKISQNDLKASEEQEHELEDDFSDEDSDIMNELRKLEESVTFPGKISQTDEKAKEEEEEEEEAEKALEDSEDSGGGLESLWEQQEFIEQLKSELKKVRATGLPTILEESESPKLMAEFKPWKLEEKFHHGELIDELRRFYRSYRERLRKFDIFNYQKMYALGFLQSKPSSTTNTTAASVPTTSAPAMATLLSQYLQLCGHKVSTADDRTTKFLKELHGDLETVYVGQTCLSWEFMQWQYEKALDLWESDPYSIRRYNEVAGEFQHFRAVLIRFLENEAFEGPRVGNYVKNRCMNRDLLQIPVIREDKVKQMPRKGKRGKDEGDPPADITTDMLIEILQESIRILWRFIRSDKQARNVILKCKIGSRAELQSPMDSELLMAVRTDLLKKERKLKEISKSRNCLLKRIKKNEEEEAGGDQDLIFFSQVDLKLVWRVLNMSRLTTDQLIWCRDKLNRISFVNRKIHVEPSIFLFPCN